MRIISSYDQLLLDEGRQEGRQEGQLKIIELLLETKFGVLEQSLKKRLVTLDVNQLESLGVAIIRLNSINDVTRWLDEHNS